MNLTEDGGSQNSTLAIEENMICAEGANYYWLWRPFPNEMISSTSLKLEHLEMRPQWNVLPECLERQRA
jgi:hypothetical protein